MAWTLIMTWLRDCWSCMKSVDHSMKRLLIMHEILHNISSWIWWALLMECPYEIWQPTVLLLYENLYEIICSRWGNSEGTKRARKPSDEENQSIESVKGQNSHYYQSIKVRSTSARISVILQSINRHQYINLRLLLKMCGLCQTQEQVAPITSSV